MIGKCVFRPILGTRNVFFGPAALFWIQTEHYGQFMSRQSSTYLFGFRSRNLNLDNGIILPIEITNDRRCESSPKPVYIQGTNRNKIRKLLCGYALVCIVSLALVVPGKRETMQRVRCVDSTFEPTP